MSEPEQDQDSEPTMTAPEGERPDGNVTDPDAGTPGEQGAGSESSDQDAEGTMTAPDADRPTGQPSGDGADSR